IVARLAIFANLRCACHLGPPDRRTVCGNTNIVHVVNLIRIVSFDRSRMHLGHGPRSKPQLERITYSQCGAPSTLWHMWMPFDPSSKLCAQLPNEGRIVYSIDRKAIDLPLALDN